jgi:hypothetical protein
MIIYISGLSRHVIPLVVRIVILVFIALRCPLTALTTFKFGGRRLGQNTNTNQTSGQANLNVNEMPIFSIHSM